MDGNIMCAYVGSTYLDLEEVNYNHRYARNKVDWKTGEPYKITEFRKALEDGIIEGEFRWLVKPKICTEAQILKDEEQLIQTLRSKYNVNKFPYTNKRRYKEKFDPRRKHRGVYGFFELGEI